MSIRKEVKRVIRKFFSSHLPPHSREYWIAKRRQLAAKAAADADDRILRNLCALLSRRFPQFDYRDLTDLIAENSYILEVLLHPNQAFGEYGDAGDRETIRRLGGRMVSLFIYISVLSSFFYREAIELSYDEPGGQYRYSGNVDFSTDTHKVLTSIDSYLSKNGYVQLSNTEVLQVVPGVAIEELYPEVTVFMCLFGPLHSPTPV